MEYRFLNVEEVEYISGIMNIIWIILNLFSIVKSSDLIEILVEMQKVDLYHNIMLIGQEKSDISR